MHCAIDVIGIPLGPWAGNPKAIMNPAINAVCLPKHCKKTIECPQGWSVVIRGPGILRPRL